MNKIFKKPKVLKEGGRLRKPCPCPRTRRTCASVVYLSVGETCPHCGFAALRVTEDRDVRCPVCGYGTARPYT